MSANTTLIPNMPNTEAVWVALFAGIGGILPTFANVAASYVAVPEQPLPHWHLLLGLSIFFFIGFILNFPLNRDSDIGKAIIIGISAPGIITNILSGATSGAMHNPPNHSTVGSWIWPSTFVAQAAAQSNNTSAGNLPDALSDVHTVLFSNEYSGPFYPSDAILTIRYRACGIDKKLADVPIGGSTVLDVPWSAGSLIVSSGSISATLSLKGNDDIWNVTSIHAQIIGQTSGQSDFFWALGAKRTGSISEINLKGIPVKTDASYSRPEVEIWAKGADFEKVCASLQSLGFPLLSHAPNPALAASLTNAIWYSADVPQSAIRGVATAHLKSGVGITTVRPLPPALAGRRRLIQVGTIEPAPGPVLTADQLVSGALPQQP